MELPPPLSSMDGGVSKGPFGKLLKFATRVSKSGTGVSTKVFLAPEAPVVSRPRSAVSKDGSMAAKKEGGVDGGKGGGSVAKPMMEASGLGEKFSVGGGSVV